MAYSWIKYFQIYFQFILFTVRWGAFPLPGRRGLHHFPQRMVRCFCSSFIPFMRRCVHVPCHADLVLLDSVHDPSQIYSVPWTCIPLLGDLIFLCIETWLKLENISFSPRWIISSYCNYLIFIDVNFSLYILSWSSRKWIGMKLKNDLYFETERVIVGFVFLGELKACFNFFLTIEW